MKVEQRWTVYLSGGVRSCRSPWANSGWCANALEGFSVPMIGCNLGEISKTVFVPPSTLQDRLRPSRSSVFSCARLSRRDALVGLSLAAPVIDYKTVSASSATREKAAASTEATTMVNVLIAAGKDAPELSLLKNLPANVKIVAIGNQMDQFADLSKEDWGSIDSVLKAGIGPNASSKALLQELWPKKLTNLKWIHSCSAGVEALLWPDLADRDVIVTNARGAFSHSLAEWAITACSWFAKDLPRLRANQKAHKWEEYEVEELRNKTLGIIGYGDIGQATAGIGRAFRMKIVALRRRTQLSEAEQRDGLQVGTWLPYIIKVIPADRLNDLMSTSDYIVAALPHTSGTDKLVNRSAIQSMKKTGVFVNVGRGGTVDEAALVEALQSGSIRGAGLDVTAKEPLPKDSPLWDLDNVLLSPHSADRTTTFQYEAVEQWLEQINRFIKKQDLVNIVDKHQGY